ncbi:MAG TPA: hypothetical protein VE964_12130 [Myxococcales bacterium]|nr:hypothetical protein [Myxococcales bacterium]
MCEIEAVSAVGALPAIASPEGTLGTRSINSPVAAQPIDLADARSFRIDLGHGPAVLEGEPAREQGKRRG